MRPFIISILLIALFGIFISMCFADATSCTELAKDNPFYELCGGTYILVIDDNHQKYFANGVEVGKYEYEAYRDSIEEPKPIEDRVSELEGKINTVESKVIMLESKTSELPVKEIVK